MLCTYCGKTIIGKPSYGGWESELAYFDGKRKTVLAPAREIAFCGKQCCWRYGVEAHKAMGMSGKDARRHLVEAHGLTPPFGARAPNGAKNELSPHHH